MSRCPTHRRSAPAAADKPRAAVPSRGRCRRACSFRRRMPPRRADKLWQHTCFEAFVAEEDVARGLPRIQLRSLHRVGDLPVQRLPRRDDGRRSERAPLISVQRETDCLTLKALIDLEPLSALRGGSALRLALSAVVEETDHRLSYWALAHPAGQTRLPSCGRFRRKLSALTPLSDRGRGAGSRRR